MKKRFRFLAGFLALAIILSLAAISITASSPINFTVSSATGFPGDSVTISVSVPPNSMIGSYTSVLTYDTNLLECTSAIKGDLPDVLALKESPVIKNGTVEHLFSTLENDGLTSGGTIFSATFLIKSGVTAQQILLSLVIDPLTDVHTTKLESNITQGSITVKNITFDTAQTNVTTFTGSDGTITVSNAANGAGTYEYSKDDGANWGASGAFTNLAAGDYKIKVRDKATPAHVSFAKTVTITKFSKVSITSAVATDATSFGGTNGYITVAASGGKGTYEYSKNGTSWQESNVLNNLAAGDYNVKVRDKADSTNVSDATSVSVSQPGAVQIQDPDVTNVIVFGASTGSIKITATGGSLTYEYTIDDGVKWQTSNEFNNLIAGTYKVRARDYNQKINSSVTKTVTITQPAAVTITTTGQTNVDVFGDKTGDITVNATGGTGTLEYQLDTGSWQLSNKFSDLPAGSYQVKAHDKNQTNNASAAKTVVITQPAAVAITTTQANVSTYSGTNGKITVSATGGMGTYEYSKDDGNTWQNENEFSGLVAGTYQVKARDRELVQIKNVSTVKSVIITQPNPPVTFTHKIVGVTNYGGSDGSITVNALGGGGTFEYSKNNGANWQTSNVFSSLKCGTYQVIARDKNEPSNAATVVDVYISQPNAVTITVAKTDVILYGASTGKITVTEALGGKGTYLYRKDNGAWQESNEFINLPAGTYKITACDKADAGNVSAISTVAITQPPVVSITCEKTEVTNFNGSNGTITVKASNGGGAFEYSKNNGASWQDSNVFENLTAGTYLIKAHDLANKINVSSATSVVITQPAAVTITVTQINASSTAIKDGSITVTAAGGKGTYEYSKDNGTTWQASNELSGLQIATYLVKARDKADTANVSSAISVEIKLRGSPITYTDPGAVAPTSSTSSTSSVVVSSTASSSSTITSSQTSSITSSTTVVSNSTTSISVEAPSGVLAPGVELKVQPVEFTKPSDENDLVKQLKKQLGNIILSIDKTYFVYEINLVKDGVQTQPNGKVKVRIPLSGLNGQTKVFRVEADGSLTDMKAVIEGDYVVFETDHFSKYVVVNTATIVNPNTGSPIMATFAFSIMIGSLIAFSAFIAPKRKRK